MTIQLRGNVGANTGCPRSFDKHPPLNWGRYACHRSLYGKIDTQTTPINLMMMHTSMRVCCLPRHAGEPRKNGFRVGRAGTRCIQRLTSTRHTALSPHQPRAAPSPAASKRQLTALPRKLHHTTLGITTDNECFPRDCRSHLVALPMLALTLP